MAHIPVLEPYLGKEELDNVTEAVISGWVSSKGHFVHDFEKGFSKYVGTKYGVAASNGTTALHLAINALGIGKGDEVILPALTYIASANAVSYTQAKPVFVDVKKEYWCIDPEKIEDAITKRTKAIMPVHLYGHPCDMAPIMKIARENDLYVIEDCAEAPGAEYKHKKVGTFGDVSCFSFFGNKIITTGEGGMALTNNKELEYTMLKLRNQGVAPDSKSNYWHDVIGFNYRMTNLEAALGVAQLKRIDSLINKRRQTAKAYSKQLKKIDGVSTHPEMSWAKNVFWAYSILVEKNRDRVRDLLAKSEIETRPFFHTVTKLPPYKTNQKFPVSDYLSTRGMNLPSSPKITELQISRVCRAIKSAIG